MSDYMPAFGHINKPRYKEEGSRDIYIRCGGMRGMCTWQMTFRYLQIRSADNCLLPPEPRSPQFVLVYPRNVCRAVKGLTLFEINYFHGGQKKKRNAGAPVSSRLNRNQRQSTLQTKTTVVECKLSRGQIKLNQQPG